MKTPMYARARPASSGDGEMEAMAGASEQPETARPARGTTAVPVSQVVASLKTVGVGGGSNGSGGKTTRKDA